MNSSRFFNNIDCEYYPCHKNIDKKDINCLFCFCPSFPCSDSIKDCSGCVLPHKSENYDKIIRILKERNE